MLIASRVRSLHPVRAGMTPKTLKNHQSNAKAALLWCAGQHGIAGRGAALLPAWSALRARINAPTERYHLTGLMRFCSAQGVLPDEVDEDVINRYFLRRAAAGEECGVILRRKLARAWNRRGALDAGWPARRLVEPPRKADGLVAWEAFPESLRQEIDSALKKVRPTPATLKGFFLKPRAKDTTYRARLAELQAFARRAVKAGRSVDDLRSLGDLLDPDLLEQVFGQQLADNKGQSTVADLLWRFYALARNTGCLSDGALARLKEMRGWAEHHRDRGMTDKNLRLVRALATTDILLEVLGIPDLMLKKARAVIAHAPQRAASHAQFAIAIAILSFAPVRIANLIAIKIGRHLQRQNVGGDYVFVVPGNEVKNGVAVECPFDRELTALIDSYIRDFRGLIPGAKASDFLFPGAGGWHKHPNSFGTRLANTVHKHVGLRVTAHQFRHAAGAMILKDNPTAHGLVQSLLGHKNVNTTIRYYAALESMGSNKAYGALLRSRVQKSLSGPSPWRD
jgi:integrase